MQVAIVSVVTTVGPAGSVAATAGQEDGACMHAHVRTRIDTVLRAKMFVTRDNKTMKANEITPASANIGA